MPDTPVSADYVAFPFDLWQNLLNACVPHLEEDDKLLMLDALCAIGDHLVGPIDQEQMKQSLEAVRQRLFGPALIDGEDCQPPEQPYSDEQVAAHLENARIDGSEGA